MSGLSTKNRLRGVLIGCGYFADFHLDAWNRSSRADVVAVADTDPERRGRAAEKFSIEGQYDDFRSMLDETRPDFVDIVTRPDTHLDLVTEIAARGIPMICQKPVAPDTATARRLVAVAAGAGVRLMIHENFRFQPWYREIKRLWESGVIGSRLHTITFRNRAGDGHGPEAYLKRQPYFQTMPRFLLFEAGIHTVDTFRYLGGEIRSVFCHHRRLNSIIAGEDTALACFDFSAGGMGVYDANRFNESTARDPRYTFGQFVLEADGGTIRLDEDGRLFLHPLGDQEREHDYQPARHGFAGDCVMAIQEHFADCLHSGEPFETGGEDYLRNLRIQDALYESSRQRRWVDLDE